MISWLESTSRKRRGPLARTARATRDAIRARVVTVAYLALGPDLTDPVPGSDASAARWAPVAGLLDAPGRLAFDHATILSDGLERARGKLEYSPLATRFCPTDFTVNELRRVYEIVWASSSTLETSIAKS